MKFEVNQVREILQFSEAKFDSFPSYAEILEVAAALKIFSVNKFNLQSCEKCRHGGVVLTKHISTGHEMVWSCDCQLGKSLLKKIQNIRCAPSHGYFVAKNWVQ